MGRLSGIVMGCLRARLREFAEGKVSILMPTLRRRATPMPSEKCPKHVWKAAGTDLRKGSQYYYDKE